MRAHNALAIEIAAALVVKALLLWLLWGAFFSDPLGASLTAWNATSSRTTLQIMLWVVLLFLPLVAIYTGWMYRVMRGKVSVKAIAVDPHRMY